MSQWWCTWSQAGLQELQDRRRYHAYNRVQIDEWGEIFPRWFEFDRATIGNGSGLRGIYSSRWFAPRHACSWSTFWESRPTWGCFGAAAMEEGRPWKSCSCRGGTWWVHTRCCDVFFFMSLSLITVMYFVIRYLMSENGNGQYKSGHHIYVLRMSLSCHWPRVIDFRFVSWSRDRTYINK